MFSPLGPLSQSILMPHLRSDMSLLTAFLVCASAGTAALLAEENRHVHLQIAPARLPYQAQEVLPHTVPPVLHGDHRYQHLGQPLKDRHVEPQHR